MKTKINTSAGSEPIDYRLLLKKYMQMVIDMEGTDCTEWLYCHLNMTTEEKDMIETISRECN